MSLDCHKSRPDTKSLISDNRKSQLVIFQVDLEACPMYEILGLARQSERKAGQVNPLPP